MPYKFKIFFAILLLVSWFIIGESRSFGEKIALLVLAVVIYVSFRMITGASLDDILAPLLSR